MTVCWFSKQCSW